MRRSTVLPTLSLCALVLASTRLRADPPCYTKKDTWQETMRASLDARVRQESEAAKAAAAEVEASPFEPFGAEVRRGREPRFLKVPVAGLRRLCLRTRNLVSRRRGRGTVCFGTPRLVAADGKSVPVTLKRPLFIAAYGHRDVRDERDRRWREAKLGARNPSRHSGIPL